MALYRDLSFRFSQGSGKPVREDVGKFISLMLSAVDG